MQALEEKRILVGLLEKGMFVSRLDRDWVGTPFAFQGFYIESDSDVETLAMYCTSVFIDTIKGIGPGAPLLSLNRGGGTFPPRGKDYRNTHAIEDEIPRAREVSEQVHSLAMRLADDIRDGKGISPGQVRDAMEPMVESLLRNVDAMFWLISLMKRDSYAYSHAVNCSALAASFGRHLALPKETLVELATGGFLLDIGKAALPPESFENDKPLGPEAMAQMRSHVEVGVQLLRESGISGAWVHDMLATHHERYDGSGYPQKLLGTGIPLAGRMAAVIDTYDAISTDRPHCKAMSKHEALQTIYRAVDQLYQGEVVEQFLQCLGVYPTGSLVELSTGQVGIVMAQNQARRLRPRIMLLLTAEKERYSPFRDMDLMADVDEMDPDAPKIVGVLDPGTYGLDPAELYLL